MTALQKRNASFLTNATLSAIIGAMVILAVAKPSGAQSAAVPYPKMAAIDQYLMTQDAEVALARSAAPESISRDADVLVLDQHGYRTAIKGANGFVCMVQRSWTAEIEDPDFWNSKLRAPTCFNAPAARSCLPRVLKRTTLVLAGKTKEQMAAGIKAAFDANQIPAIEAGAIGYMLSKQGYLNSRDAHWHPHIMIFVPQGEGTGWGANLPGSPIFGSTDHTDRLSVFYIPVPKWSDGSADTGGNGSH